MMDALKIGTAAIGDDAVVIGAARRAAWTSAAGSA
jgi:hypothetical protein